MNELAPLMGGATKPEYTICNNTKRAGRLNVGLGLIGLGERLLPARHGVIGHGGRS